MNASAFMFVLALCALFLPRGDAHSDASGDAGATVPSKAREQWPSTLRATERYHLQPFDSRCYLLPWSAMFTIFVRMLTDRPTDNHFLKDVSVAPENLPRFVASHQPGTKLLLLFTEFAWTLMALIGAGVIGARFANQCGGERRQQVDASYMYYYTKLLTVAQGVIILALCAFVLVFLANYGLGSSIGKAPEYFENAIHDLRVYTNLTSEELGSVSRSRVERYPEPPSFPGFVKFASLLERPVGWNRSASWLSVVWNDTERERSLTARILADISARGLQQGKEVPPKAPEKKNGTQTEQGVAKMMQRFVWFDEMTGIWSYYAYPILRPIAVYSLAIAALVAAAGTALGHKNHSADEDPIKRKPISNIAGHTLLAAACVMLVSCIACLLVIKRSLPHAIAGQCYFCDAYRRKDYQQFDYAQDMVWPRSEKASAFANLYVGDVLRYCGGEGVSINFFIRKDDTPGEKKQEPKKEAVRKLVALLSKYQSPRCEAAAPVVKQHEAQLFSWAQGAWSRYDQQVSTPTSSRRLERLAPTVHDRRADAVKTALLYYLCSILEHYATFKTQSGLVLVPGALPKEAVVVARQDSGPGTCSPVFGIVNTGISLFCDAFLEYLKSLLLTLFLAVLLFIVGMPTLLMLSKYYLTMLPPPELPEPPRPPTRKPKKEKKRRAGSVKSSQSSSGSGGDTQDSSYASDKLGLLRDVTATGSTTRKGSDGSPRGNEKSGKTDALGEGKAGKKLNKNFDIAQRKSQGPEPLRLPEPPHDLFSEDLLGMFSEDTASSLSDIETHTGEPAIRVKNVKTRSKPHWCVVDTSTMTIPISQLERARDFVTSSSAASLTPKTCNVEISRVPPKPVCPFHDMPPKKLISTGSAHRSSQSSATASTGSDRSVPRRSETEKKPQKRVK